MTATNKRLLISESRGDSNRCTPWRRKPDQHVTRFPSSVRVWSMTIRISRDPHRREEGLPTQSTAPGRPIRRVVPNFFPTTVNGAVGKKSSFCWQPTNSLTGLISPACDRYVQYLLTGPTERSLIDTGEGYNLDDAGLPCIHSPIFPTSCPHFPLVALPGLQFNQVLTTKSKY
jgi:hypothetical protein